jgi:hypothetical protein
VAYNDGLWQRPRVGPSGRHEPSPEGGRGAGLRAPETRGADSSPKATELLRHGYEKVKSGR